MFSSVHVANLSVYTVYIVPPCTISICYVLKVKFDSLALTVLFAL